MSRRAPKPPLACSWLRPLAEGYLGSFTVSRQTSAGLWGDFHERAAGRTRVGFFVGFLIGDHRLLRPLNPSRSAGPECLVFAFVRPVGGTVHERLVRSPGSLFCQSYDFAMRYTVTRPRFEFHETGLAAIARHVPLASFPARLRARYARNFFIETLALLVRTRLPEYLRAIPLTRR